MSSGDERCPASRTSTAPTLEAFLSIWGNRTGWPPGAGTRPPRPWPSSSGRCSVETSLADVPRAKGPKRMPTVLTHREVLLVLQELTGKHFVVGVSLYSAGLRLEECLRLRVKDVDFELRQVLVRDGKGRKDRYVALAQRAAPLVKAQIERVSGLHKRDRAAGHGWAPLPGALHRKDPSAGHALGSVPLPRDQNSPGSCDRQDRTPSAPPDRGTAAR